MKNTKGIVQPDEFTCFFYECLPRCVAAFRMFRSNVNQKRCATLCMAYFFTLRYGVYGLANVKHALNRTVDRKVEKIRKFWRSLLHSKIIPNDVNLSRRHGILMTKITKRIERKLLLNESLILIHGHSLFLFSQITRTVFIIAILYTLSWTPYNIFKMLILFGGLQDQPHELFITIVADLCSFASSAVSPVILFSTSVSFRQAFTSCLRLAPRASTPTYCSGGSRRRDYSRASSKFAESNTVSNI